MQDPHEVIGTSKPKRTSKRAKYFSCYENEDYSRNILKEDVLLKKKIIKKDHMESTNKLWRHEERQHPLIYRKHEPLHGKPCC